MLSHRNFMLFILSLILPASLCAMDIQVQALMPGMVVLNVDGERLTLKQGQTKKGIRMVSSDTATAVLEVDGEQATYKMGTTISTQFKQAEILSEQIIIDQYGMYRAYGSINGQTVSYLVDTGASSVAMSARDARKLGIPYRLEGIPTKTSTASGIADAWVIELKSVRLGKLVEKNVRGVVIDGDHPAHILLGMTFLNRMKVEKEAGKMIISQKQ